MARSGITYIDVSKAAQSIKLHGQNPTVDRVLACLGTGSKSTIAPLLKQWKDSHIKEPITSGLPDELLNAVKSLYEQINCQADEKIEHFQVQSQQDIAQLQQQLTTANEALSSLASTRDELESQLKAKIQEKETLAGQLNALVTKLRQNEATLNGTHQQLVDYKETIKNQRAEVSRVRDHLEHYQTVIAEERQRERHQYQSQINHLEASYSQAVQANEQIQGDVTLLQAALQQTQEKYQQQETCNHNITLELKIQEQNNQHLTSKLSEASKKIALLDQQLLAANNQLKNTGKQLVIVQAERDNLKINCEKLENKMDGLSDQHHILSQEKALLQGQFKQLQNTIECK